MQRVLDSRPHMRAPLLVVCLVRENGAEHLQQEPWSLDARRQAKKRRRRRDPQTFAQREQSSSIRSVRNNQCEELWLSACYVIFFTDRCLPTRLC